MQANDYLGQIQALLPPGPAWAFEADAVLLRQSAALAESFARVDVRSVNVLAEADPRQTFELLPEWERDLGLPDKCSVQSGLTLADRRDSVVAKYVATGGQSPAYFIGIAKALGYPSASITQYKPRRCGRRFNTLYGGIDWAHVWQLNLPAQKITQRVSGSPFGERYRVWGDAALECTINRLKPAHTLVKFKYG